AILETPPAGAIPGRVTELAEAGASDAILMALAGHTQRRILEHHSHVRMAAKRTALEKRESGLMGVSRVVVTTSNSEDQLRRCLMVASRSAQTASLRPDPSRI